MKKWAFAAMLAVGGVFLCGCLQAGRAVAATSSGTVKSSAIIRSQKELNRYLSATATYGSPLSALSTTARTRFLSSITFNEKGITGFRYGDLQRELTASQIVAILRLFGVEKDIALIPNVRVETASDRRVASAFGLRGTAGRRIDQK